LVGHYAIGNSTYREHGGLGRRDDCTEGIDAEHSEVADGEGGASDVGRMKAAGSGTISQVTSADGNFA
jgi:hypothetical protein